MHSGAFALLDERQHRQSLQSRDERRPCRRVALRRLVYETRCAIYNNQLHGNTRGFLSRASTSQTFLPAQLTAAISRSKDIDDLFLTCRNNWDALNHIHISAALSAAVKLPGTRTAGSAPLLDSLVIRFAQTLPDATIREVATVLWSLAKLGRPVPLALLSHVLAAQQRGNMLRTASPQALANILWSLATWRTRGPDSLLPLLLEQCYCALPAFQPQDTANVLWALARLNCSGEPLPLPPLLLPDLLAVAATQASAMTPQGLATSVWACRRLRHRHPTFLRAAVGAFHIQLPAASPTDIALMTASLAHLHFRSPVLLRAVADRCCGPESNRGPPGTAQQSVAPEGGPGPPKSFWSPLCRQRLLWAFATLRFRHPAAVRALLLGISGLQDAKAAAEEGIAESDLLEKTWSWESGGIQSDEDDDDGDGFGGGCGGNVALVASSLIWCLARLGCASSAGPEQRLVLAAAERLWAVRASAALRHTAMAAWGLEHLGLGQQRFLKLAGERLREALERSHASHASQASHPSTSTLTFSSPRGTASGSGPVPGSGSSSGGNLSSGDLDAAVMVLWCLGRRGSLTAPAATASQAAATASGAAAAEAAAEARILDSFSSAASRLLPRLSVRQLPRVCCAYVQLGRSDGEVLGLAAELLMGPQTGGGGSSTVDSGGSATVAAAEEEEEEVADDDDGEEEGKQRRACVAVQLRKRFEDQGSEGDDDYQGLWEGSEDEDGKEEEELGWELEGEQEEHEAEAAAAGFSSASGRSGTVRGGCGGRLLGHLPRNGLAMTLWALASAGYASPQLMQRVANRVMKLFPQLPAAPAVAGGVAGDAAAAAVERHMVASGAQRGLPTPPTPPTSPPQQVVVAVPAAGPSVAASRWAALILWAFAASDCYNTVLYDHLLSYVIRRVSRLGPGRVAMVMWSCAVAGHYRRDVLESLCGALREDLRGLPPASFTQANWAVAHLSAGLCMSWRGPATPHLAALGPHLNPHQAAVLLWSLAVQQLVRAAQDTREFAAAVDLLLARLGAAVAVAEVEVEVKVGAEVQPGAPRWNGPRERDWDWNPGAAASGGTCRGVLRGVGDREGAQGLPDSDRGQEPCLDLDRDLDSPSGRIQLMSSPLEPGVALIAAESLALLLASPHQRVRQRVEAHLSQHAATRTPHLPPHLPPAPPPAPDSTPADGATAPGGSDNNPAEVRSGLGPRPGGWDAGRSGRLASVPPITISTSTSCCSDIGIRGLIMSQLAAAWQLALQRRHPEQAAVAAAARQLGYTPRLLRTHGSFPLALPCAVELPDTAPGPAVVLLADQSDFATNVVGQPLGPLFTTVQLLRECGWLVAVVVAPQFAALRHLPHSCQIRHLRHLLLAAGVRVEAGPGVAAAAEAEAVEAAEEGKELQNSSGGQQKPV